MTKGAGMEVSKPKIAFFANLTTLRGKAVILSCGPQCSAPLFQDCRVWFILLSQYPAQSLANARCSTSVGSTALNTNHPSPGKTSGNLSWNKAQT